MTMLDNSRLNITLYSADMTALGLTFEKLDWKNSRSRTVISTLLGKANEETGFSVGGKRLLIEATPVKDGGCLLRFTILQQTPVKKRKHYHMKKDSSPVIFRFERSDDMMDAVHRLFDGNRHGTTRSKLYHAADGYFLVLLPTRRSAFSACHLLSEYGTLWGRGKLSLCHVEEFGTLIAEYPELNRIAACLGCPSPSACVPLPSNPQT